MTGYIFYGIILDDFRDWFDPQRMKSESFDASAFNTRMEKTLYDIWNCRKFDDILTASSGCVLRKFVFESTKLAIVLNSTFHRTNEYSRLGVFKPDAPDFVERVEKAVVAVENEVELYEGMKCGIPTKKLIQWHLAVENR